MKRYKFKQNVQYERIVHELPKNYGKNGVRFSRPMLDCKKRVQAITESIWMEKYRQNRIKVNKILRGE